MFYISILPGYRCCPTTRLDHDLHVLQRPFEARLRVQHGPEGHHRQGCDQ